MHEMSHVSIKVEPRSRLTLLILPLFYLRDKNLRAFTLCKLCDSGKQPSNNYTTQEVLKSAATWFVILKIFFLKKFCLFL